MVRGDSDAGNHESTIHAKVRPGSDRRAACFDAEPGPGLGRRVWQLRRMWRRVWLQRLRWLWRIRRLRLRFLLQCLLRPSPMLLRSLREETVLAGFII